MPTAALWDCAPPSGALDRAALARAAIGAAAGDRFQMRAGLNLVRLTYDAAAAAFVRRDRASLPTPAAAARAAAGWDGAVVALSGREQFELELRLASPGGPVVLLHENAWAHGRQRSSPHEATRLARVLLGLYVAVGARYCVFPLTGRPAPAGGPWLASLYPLPELALLPSERAPGHLPPGYRRASLRPRACMIVSLPVKRYPGEEVVGGPT